MYYTIIVLLHCLKIIKLLKVRTICSEYIVYENFWQNVNFITILFGRSLYDMLAFLYHHVCFFLCYIKYCLYRRRLSILHKSLVPPLQSYHQRYGFCNYYYLDFFVFVSSSYKHRLASNFVSQIILVSNNLY